jgi:hypothetical protein
VSDRTIGTRRKYSRPLPQQEGTEVKPTTRMPRSLDQMTQAGSSFYSPYTDTLSVLRIQNPLLKPV